jgi:hypothetical protein
VQPQLVGVVAPGLWWVRVGRGDELFLGFHEVRVP